MVGQAVQPDLVVEESTSDIAPGKCLVFCSVAVGLEARTQITPFVV